MYHIHTNLGFVLSSKPYREADRIYQIFTKDFGLINAIAQGIRFEKSKLRYSIEEFSISNFSLVHGKEFWRIVGAEDNLDSKIKSKKILLILAKLSLLIKRFVHGEEQNEKIFDVLYDLSQIKEQNQNFENLESLAVLQILYNLGYVAKTEDVSQCISDKISNQYLNLDQEKRRIINQKINNALKNSQL